MLYIDVAKVDINVAHVVVAIVCSKCFYLDVAKVYLDVNTKCMWKHVSSVVFRCFVHMFA